MKYKPKFYLRDPKATKETPVICFFHFGGQVVKIGTEVTVQPKHWNQKGQCVRRGVAYEALNNDRLRDVAEKLVASFAELRKEGRMPTSEQVRQRYRELDNPDRIATLQFFEAYDRYLDESAHKLREASVKVHRTTISHLKEFEKNRVAKLTLDGIDLNTFEDLQRHLITVAKLNNESTWKGIKTMRAFLRHAHEKGWTANASYLHYTQKKILKGERSDQAFLRPEELKAVMDLDLSDCPRLERVRDLFVVQSHTGVRYGDLLKLGPEHVGVDDIRFVTEKNSKQVVVPLLPEAHDILKKYSFRLPRMSNQKQNKSLKELMQRAGIDREMVVVNYRGAVREEKVVRKYEMIGTHTAKRTFVSILRRRGVSIETIMKVTGNTRRTIEKYILIDEEDVRQEIVGAWKSEDRVAADTLVGGANE